VSEPELEAITGKIDCLESTWRWQPLQQPGLDAGPTGNPNERIPKRHAHKTTKSKLIEKAQKHCNLK
jgi:hypothetical protein